MIVKKVSVPYSQEMRHLLKEDDFMKIVSWNLNGLIGTIKKHPLDTSNLLDPDIICLQEIRTAKEPLILPMYLHYWNHAIRSGYAGTALLSKQVPICVQNGFKSGFEDDEGRIITAMFSSFFLVNVYVPNAKKGLSGGLRRQAYRIQWDRELKDHVFHLQEEKPVILCGDFNVARGKLDYYEENMKQYWREQGFISDEQSSVENLLDLGLVDVFRFFHPDTRSYTWWSNRLNKRDEDRGWRLDYFFISESILKKVRHIRHLSEVMGSDHCPVELEVSI